MFYINPYSNNINLIINIESNDLFDPDFYLRLAIYVDWQIQRFLYFALNCNFLYVVLEKNMNLC